MRKDNFLISMINKGVVSPRLPLPRWLGLGRSRTLLTKTLEWNLRWGGRGLNCDHSPGGGSNMTINTKSWP